MRPDFSRPTILYGGSFDPVHEGHLHVAALVKNKLPGWQLVFVPAAFSPGKPVPWAPADLRLRWLQLALQGTGFSTWETELEREGPSYTLDTLAEAARLGAQREKLGLLMGADSYRGFTAWRYPERIRALCRLVVVNRPGHPIRQQDSDDLLLAIPPHPASSTAVRAGLAANPPLFHHLPRAVKSELENLILLSKNPYARNQE